LDCIAKLCDGNEKRHDEYGDFVESRGGGEDDGMVARGLWN
jgi:hypothetical protein